MVTVRAPEAGRRIRGAHPQAWQMNGTHVGAGDPEAKQAWAGPQVHSRGKEAAQETKQRGVVPPVRWNPTYAWTSGR